MTKNKLTTLITLLIFMSITFTSCEAIAGIFKAGMWFGVIGVIVVIAIIFWLIRKAKK